LGLLYESGTGVPRDRRRAIALFKSAASHGITAAQAHLASLGGGKIIAARPAQDAAMNDFQDAQRMITSRSADDVARATSLFRRSADQHNAMAEYDLGYCYERGLGVSADPGEALKWYRRAKADSTSATLRDAAEAGARYNQRLLAR
jgi:hypothetical protein